MNVREVINDSYSKHELHLILDLNVVNDSNDHLKDVSTLLQFKYWELLTKCLELNRIFR